MGFASRTVSMIRFRVRGEVEGSFWEAVDDGVKKGAFRELDTAGDEVGMGWTSIDDFTDNTFASASYVFGNYVALSLRVDTARVPARILEIHLRKETQRVLQETGRTRLSSAQRRELRDALKESLKRQMFPSIQVYDLIWDTSRAVLYFGSLSTKALERVTAHFKKCFGLALIPIIPYIRAEEIVENSRDKQALAELTSCSMVP